MWDERSLESRCDYHRICFFLFFFISILLKRENNEICMTEIKLMTFVMRYAFSGCQIPWQRHVWRLKSSKRLTHSVSHILRYPTAPRTIHFDDLCHTKTHNNIHHQCNEKESVFIAAAAHQQNFIKMYYASVVTTATVNIVKLRYQWEN